MESTPLPVSQIDLVIVLVLSLISSGIMGKLFNLLELLFSL